MKGLLRAGGVALILGSLVFAGRSWSEQKKPPAPRTRIAIFNLTSVMKNYNKYKNFQAEIQADVARFQKTARELQNKIDRLTRESGEKDLAVAKKDDIEKQLKQLKDEREGVNVEAKNLLGRKSDEHMVLLYKEVQQAVQRYARANDIEVVLHHNDADEKTQEAEYWSPANVQRKFQAGACVPLYMTPGIDISAEIVAAMNAAVKIPPAEKE